MGHPAGREGNKNAKSGVVNEDESYRDPSTPRPEAPKSGAPEKSGRSGRDDSFEVWRDAQERIGPVRPLRLRSGQAG